MPASHATDPDRIREPLSRSSSASTGATSSRSSSRPSTAPFHSTRHAAALLDASPERLALRIEAADDATLERTQGVVIDHLKRFAFREELGEVRRERAA